MIGFSSTTSTPPSVTADALTLAISLLTAAADPKGSLKRLVELKAATEQLAGERANHEKASADREAAFTAKSNQRQAELNMATFRLDERIADHEKRAASREVTLSAREKHADELNAAAEKLKAEAEKVKAELQRRLRAMEGGAA
jgi:uncharacterized protein (DUF3084 family)